MPSPDKSPSRTDVTEMTHERPASRPDLPPKLKNELEQRLKNIQSEQSNLDALLEQANLTDILDSVNSIKELREIILKRLDSVDGAIKDIIGESEESDRSLAEFSSFFHEQTALKKIDLALTDLGKIPKPQQPAISSRTPSNPQNPAFLEALKKQNKEIATQTIQTLDEMLAELQSDEAWEKMPGLTSSSVESLLAAAKLTTADLKRPLTEIRAACLSELKKLNNEMQTNPTSKTQETLDTTAKLAVLKEIITRALKIRK